MSKYIRDGQSLDVRDPGRRACANHNASVHQSALEYAEGCIPVTDDLTVRSGGEPVHHIAYELMTVYPPDTDIPRRVAHRALVSRIEQCPE